MKKISLFFIFQVFYLFGQNPYTSYFTGSSNDVTPNPNGGVCLMGGATENDNAMRWFLNRANGGDVLVLRASGGSGYNSYFFTELGVNVNSVETIVYTNANSTAVDYIVAKINKAEAIWFAGGNQANYVNLWRNNEIESALNNAINQRNVVVGGTSAGMAVLGEYYNSALNGSPTSSDALANPYSSTISLSGSDFLSVPYMQNVITDTHFDNPDRKGRLVSFMARLSQENDSRNLRGIACDEFTAVCVDNQGLAKVFGGFPTNDDNAYFIQINCNATNFLPENCVANQNLTWNLQNEALKVYNLKGTQNGANTFDLNNWINGSGGNWQNWYVNNGVLNSASTSQPICTLSNDSFISNQSNIINPVKNHLLEISNENDFDVIELYDLSGRLIFNQNINTKEIFLPNEIHSGSIVIAILKTQTSKTTQKIIIE